MDSSEPLADNIASTPVNNNAKTKTTAAIAATAATASIPDSPQVQESPFFRYINNLSPIEPVKVAHNIAQGFPGLNSPPLVFASPRIISLREASFLKRSRSPIQQNSHDNIKGKIVICDQDISYKLSSSPSQGLAADVDNECDMKDYANTEPCNSPVCVDQYLADPVEVDCANSVPSADVDIKQSSDIQRPSLGNLTELKDSGSESEEGQDQAEWHVNVSRQFQVKLVETTCGAGPCRNKGELKHVEWLSNECPSIGSSLPVDFDSHVRQGECSLIPNAESEDGGYHDNQLLSVPDLPHHVQDHDVPSQKKDNSKYTSVENVVSDDSEASQKHRGLLRRCLQFEEAITGASRSSSSAHATHNKIKLNLPAAVVEPTLPQNSHVTQSSSSMKRQLMMLSPSKTSLAGPRCSGNTSFTGSKQLGFGLHLNSIVASMPIGSDATACMRQSEDYMSVREVNSKPHTNSHVSDNLKRCSITSHENETPDQDHETNLSNIVNLGNVKSLPCKEHLSIASSGEQPANTVDKRKLNQEATESSQQLSQSSPKKKKKKTAGSDDSDGCKRCNCKKSKCLKLYCDCFAAGIYCSEPCACQGCFNRLEHEGKVHEARQLIESRNPLAFAPKVVQNVTEFPTVNAEDGNLMTPSSARHKRGCNCKKSMCLKKYCECYQSNVGCSLGCRCEGCKNVYGRKEEYLPIERCLNKEVMNSRVLDERSCRLFHGKLEGGARGILNAELYDLQNLTPLTPAIQNSDHGMDALKSRLSDSDVSSLSSSGKFTTFLKHSQSVDVLHESRKGITDADSFDWHINHDNNETRNQLVHRDATVNNACHATVLSDFSSLDDASASSERNDLSQLSQIQLPLGNGGGPLSSNSLRWRSSPMTPMGRLAETKYLEYSDSGSKLHDIPEDDTPEVLKETSTPVKSVKASSPNQKRVSPPHNHAHALGSSSSGGLRSGRKFILKGVPSFPPLTPHSDSKGMANKNASSQNADGK